MNTIRPRSLLPALLLLLAIPFAAHAQVGIGVSITLAPPALPVYEQPPIPDSGYIWTPGYWQWGPEGYFWVPGTWVLAPSPGLLWTPGYWGWGEGVYLWHGGYWGPHVGFYGGVNYGYGYGGNGYEGGYWRGRDFYYNRSVSNVNNVHITNVYNKTVINNVTVNRVSYNGGAGGIRAQPTSQQMSAAHERHVEVTSTQRQHEQTARGDHALLASVNKGRPAIAATTRPAEFSGKGVVAAHRAAEPLGRSDRPPTASRQAERVPAASHNTAHTPGTERMSVNHNAERPPVASHSADRPPTASHSPQRPQVVNHGATPHEFNRAPQPQANAPQHMQGAAPHAEERRGAPPQAHGRPQEQQPHEESR